MLSALAWGQALEEGKRAFDAGNYAEAARLFEKAHQSSPRCDILFFLGLARYRQKQPGAALIAFQSAVQCDPTLVNAHLAMAEAYAERGNRDEALKAFTRVLSLAPGNAAALRGAASIYLDLQHPAQARPLLEALVRVDAGDPQAHADLGAVYFADGNQDGAEAQFREALRLKPAQPSALMGLGYIYVRKGEDDKAIPFLQKAAGTSPREYKPHFLLGSAYNHLGRDLEAAAEFETALRLGSNDPEVYYQLARAYGKLGRQADRRQALARFSEVTRRSNQDIDAQRSALKLTEQAKSLVDAGDLQAAAARLEEARVLRPSDDKILFRLAGLYFDLGHLDVARDYAQEAISLAPSEWLYHYLLGLIEKGSKRWKQARTSLDLAAKLNPSAAEVHNALGELALAQKEPAAAVASFQRAIELDPRQQAYRDHLAAATRAAARSQRP